MVTLQEYLNQQYPAKEDKEQIKEIIIGGSKKSENTIDKEQAKELDGKELDLREYPNLETVVINSLKSKLTSLDLTNCPNLVTLGVTWNQLTSLDLSQNKKLEKLYIGDNKLTNLNLSNCSNLKEIYCYKNQLTKSDLIGLTQLEKIGCKVEGLLLKSPTDFILQNYSDKENTKEIKLSSDLKFKQTRELILTDYPNLEKIEARGDITKVTIQNCPQLNEINIFDLKDNQKLEIINCPNLEKLDCRNNRLTELDLTDLTNLKKLYASNNYLNKINYLSDLGKLVTLEITNNNFSTQDLSIFSNLVNLQTLEIGSDYWGIEKNNQGIYNKFSGSLEPLKSLNKLKKLDISNTDVDSGLEYLNENIEVTSSTRYRTESKVNNINLEKQWKASKFSWEQMHQWRKSGLELADGCFAAYLKNYGFHSESVDLNLIEWRNKWRKSSEETQAWLDKNYPKEKRSEIREIYLNEPSLEGELDLGDFTYYNGVKVYISLAVDETKLLIIKNQRENIKIIKLVQAWEYINQKYPIKEDREKLTELIIYDKNLEGNLDFADFINLKKLNCGSNKLTSLNISDCSQLEEIYFSDNQLTNLDIAKNDKIAKLSCSSNKLTNLNVRNCSQLTELWCVNNLLTSLTLPTNPTNLKILWLSDNNFPVQDLSFLVSATNLEKLNLGNYNEEKINQGIYNCFIGSLGYLSGMEKLKRFHINNTDVNEVDIDKLPTSLEYIYYSTKERPDCQLTALVPQLKEYEWKDVHSDFYLGYRRGWEKAGFNKEQTSERIQEGFKPKDYIFISWLDDNRELKEKFIKYGYSLESYKLLYSVLGKLIPKKEVDEIRERGALCKECDQLNFPQHWCKPLNVKYFQAEFDKWTSGNSEIDKFIQNIQLRAKKPKELLEWIPYEQFSDIKYLTEGGFSKIYKAKWIDGYIKNWNTQENKWERIRTNHDTEYEGMVVLKILNNSRNMNAEFLQEITCHKLFNISENIVNCYGISQDPSTKDYIMVMEGMKGGNLRQYLKDNYGKLNFSDKFNQLCDIIGGLNSIHKQGLIHHDFHSGNMLISMYNDCFISDLGLSRPANEEEKKDRIFGVMPYVAPEVLRGEPYTQASDIYSFGIIAYELLTGLPYCDNIPHDTGLALKVCNGLRPKFPEQLKIPQLLKDLIKRCWDANPKQRQTTEELYGIINGYRYGKDAQFTQQVQEAEAYNKTLPEHIRFPKYEIHSGTSYCSKSINTKQITELLKTYSADLAIDFTKLNLEDNKKEEEVEQVAQVEVPPKGNN